MANDLNDIKDEKAVKDDMLLLKNLGKSSASASFNGQADISDVKKKTLTTAIPGKVLSLSTLMALAKDRSNECLLDNIADEDSKVSFVIDQSSLALLGGQGSGKTTFYERVNFVHIGDSNVAPDYTTIWSICRRLAISIVSGGKAETALILTDTTRKYSSRISKTVAKSESFKAHTDVLSQLRFRVEALTNKFSEALDPIRSIVIKVNGALGLNKPKKDKTLFKYINTKKISNVQSVFTIFSEKRDEQKLKGFIIDFSLLNDVEGNVTMMVDKDLIEGYKVSKASATMEGIVNKDILDGITKSFHSFWKKTAKAPRLNIRRHYIEWQLKVTMYAPLLLPILTIDNFCRVSSFNSTLKINSSPVHFKASTNMTSGTLSSGVAGGMMDAFTEVSKMAELSKGGTQMEFRIDAVPSRIDEIFEMIKGANITLFLLNKNNTSWITGARLRDDLMTSDIKELVIKIYKILGSVANDSVLSGDKDIIHKCNRLSITLALIFYNRRHFFLNEEETELLISSISKIETINDV